MNIFEICEHYFCCPICKSELNIQRIHGTPDGVLLCAKCGHKYLILDNIPIMLPFSYVETKIKDQFFQRHPNERHLFKNLSSSMDDNIKQHQIETWGRQYFEGAIKIPVARIIPQTESAHIHNLFYRNSRKLLFNIVWNKRKSRDNNLFLDIGCGEGAFTSIGSQNFKLYFGMDISFNAISKCYSKYPFKNCVFFVGDAENIPLKNASVDICAAQWLFEHLNNPYKCTTEIFRVLSNHGNVYIDTNHKEFSFTYRWCQMIFTPEYYWYRMEEAGHSHDRFFKRKQIQNMFKQVGFRRINTRLCYFLLDMFISNKIITPMFRIIGKIKHVEPQMQKHISNETKNSLPSGLIEFAKKDEFIPAHSTKENLIKLINFIIQISYHLLIPDRILEIFWKGESVILVAEKRTELLEQRRS